MAGQINRRKRNTSLQIIGYIRNERELGGSLAGGCGIVNGNKTKTISYIVPSSDSRSDCTRLAPDFFSFLKWRMSSHSFPYLVDQEGEISEMHSL